MPLQPEKQPFTGYGASAGSPAMVDPVLRGYLLSEWRMHWAALRYLAPILGFEDRLPLKPN